MSGITQRLKIKLSASFFFNDLLNVCEKLSSRHSLCIHLPLRKQYVKHVLKETSTAKSYLVLLEWTPRLCLRIVLYETSQHFYHYRV